VGTGTRVKVTNAGAGSGRLRGRARPNHGIHKNKPWRIVEHIEHCVGERGGEYWMLTLDCGHIVPRTIPKFSFLRMTPRRAPERLRCILCPDEETNDAAT
jgi:hypothetical protein